MYLSGLWTPIAPVVTDRWLGLAKQLGAHFSTTASTMSDPAETKALFLADPDAVAAFRPPWHWVTLVTLLPSQQIVAHRDQPLPPGVRRWHVPLQTNPGCWSFHAGEWQQLEVGQRYLMRPDEEHGAVNWGSEVRIHLMIDQQIGIVA